jgi:NAD(P)-dependent dehydrogenase (short-subunit alcohol dehydrogenase family)
VAHLEGKVAIVTGAGRGIGRAHALALAREGAAVLVNDLGSELNGDGSANRAPADEVVREIVEAGGRAAADCADISDWDAAGVVVESALQAFGRLDIVVNNAGIARFATIDKVTRRDWERTIAVHLTGTAALSHCAAAYWRDKGPEGGRSILNTSSAVGLHPVPRNPMYVAAKAGIAALTISSATELAEFGVRVNCLAPVARSRVSEVVAAELMTKIPQGFDPMSPEHVAAVAAFLVSPLCPFTGRIVGVVGDDVTIYQGWTVVHHLSNGNRKWTVDTLRTAFANVPVQQSSTSQSVEGVEELRTPSDEVLKQLAAVEHA